MSTSAPPRRSKTNGRKKASSGLHPNGNGHQHLKTTSAIPLSTHRAVKTKRPSLEQRIKTIARDKYGFDEKAASFWAKASLGKI